MVSALKNEWEGLTPKQTKMKLREHWASLRRQKRERSQEEEEFVSERNEAVRMERAELREWLREEEY